MREEGRGYWRIPHIARRSSPDVMLISLGPSTITRAFRTCGRDCKIKQSFTEDA
jgi:hypothetical protein